MEDISEEPSMSNIPPEIISHMCEKLETPDLLRLSQTSGKIKRICQFTIKQRHLENIQKALTVIENIKKPHVWVFIDKKYDKASTFRHRISIRRRDKEIYKIEEFTPNDEPSFLKTVFLGSRLIENEPDLDDPEPVRSFELIDPEYNDLTDILSKLLKTVSLADLIKNIIAGSQIIFGTQERTPVIHGTIRLVPPEPKLVPIRRSRFPESIGKSFHTRLENIKKDIETLEEQGYWNNECKNLVGEIEEQLKKFDEKPTEELELEIDDLLKILEERCTESYLTEKFRLSQIRSRGKKQR